MPPVVDPLEVPAVRTPYTDGDLLRAVAEAYRYYTGAFPYRAQMAVVWAIYAHETGRAKSCWNWNPGNVKQFDLTKPYFKLKKNLEQVNGVLVLKPEERFRPFNSLADGVTYWMRLISTSKRYVAAWRELQKPAPDAVAVVRYIFAGGYFTGDVGQYQRSVQKLYAECFALPEKDWPQPLDVRPTPPELADTDPGTPQALHRNDPRPEPGHVNRRFGDVEFPRASEGEHDPLDHGTDTDEGEPVS